MEIDSLKIEGRLKTEYYVASIVNVYRNAIDDYKKDPQNYDHTKYLNEIEKIKKQYPDYEVAEVFASGHKSCDDHKLINLYRIWK